MAGKVLHSVLSAWLYFGKMVKDAEEGIWVHVICEMKEGQIGVCAETVDGGFWIV